MEAAAAYRHRRLRIGALLLRSGLLSADKLAEALEEKEQTGERLGEALAILKGAWSDGPFSLEGRHYRIKDYDGIPKPTQKPRPPILVGGGGPKLLRLAGRHQHLRRHP